MSNAFLDVFRKDTRPHIQAFYDDYINRKDPDFFQPFGTQVYSGKQGSGKTISAVKHTLDLKTKYPKSILVSNLLIEELQPIKFTNIDQLKSIQQKMESNKHYIYFQSHTELHDVLTNVNNGKLGVIYLIDEIHTYFNSLESKDTPIHIFTEISQQRKQRKLIIGTSQIFMRLAKAFREQCDNVIMCNTYAGVITKQRAYEGETIELDYSGKLLGTKRKTGWFFQSRKIRNAFDTYQKVVSGQAQYEQVNQQPIILKQSKRGKKLKVST